MNYNTPVLKIPDATPSEIDAAQYIIRYGKVQYNLCGEFCVAYCAQDEAHTDSAKDFLDYWEVKEPNWFVRSVFSNGLSRTTGIVDLERMLSAYDYMVPCRRYTSIKNPNLPENISMMLDYHQLIIGVKIDHTGYLVGSGTPHWVVLENVEIVDKNHAIANIYNPFTNKIEPYSWREFMTSTGSYKNGIYVER